MIDSWQHMVDFHGMMRCHIIFLDSFMQSFFENMQPDYTNLPSKYYGVGKGRTYNRRGAFRDPVFPRPPPPLVSHPPRVVSLPSEMEATSQVGRTQGRQ
jgi:hypothetical protein